MMRTFTIIAASFLLAPGALADVPDKPDLEDLDTLIAGLEDTPLKILSTGEGTKSEIRYEPREASAKVRMRSDYELLDDPESPSNFRPVAIPSILYDLTMNAKPAQDNAEMVATTVTVDGATVLGRADPGNRMYQNALQTSRALIDTSVVVTAATDATHQSVENNGAINIIGALEYMLTTLRFPEAPVAPGAQWRILSPSDALPGLDTNTVTDVTLDEITDHTYTITFTTRTAARLSNPNDNTTPLRSMLVASEGTVTLDRHLAMPVEGEVTSATWATRIVQNNNQRGILTQGFAQTATILPPEDDDTDP